MPVKKVKGGYRWGSKGKVYKTKKAAQQGDADAQNNYGTFFYNGDLISKDMDRAFYWYQLSADQGNPIAMKNLGSFYLIIYKDVDLKHGTEILLKELKMQHH